MHVPAIPLVAAISLGLGTAVGATGNGGVLMIPALWLLLGVPLRDAMGTVLAASAANGALAAWLYFRRGSIRWPIAIPLCAGALVSGFAGGTINPHLPAPLLIKGLGAVMAASCGWTFLRRGEPADEARARRRAPQLFGVGFVSGLAAGLTGAGGPLVSVPLMTALAFPFLATVAASQVLQLVASASGAAAFWRAGSIDLQMLALIVPLQLLGIWAGVRLAHRIDVALARKVLAALGVLVGVVLVWR
jgi:uncharacterized membrane protein YfcA